MAGDDFSSYVLDCLAAARIGPVTRERLFSGSGLRIDGELFGVILRGTLYFVVDDQTRTRFLEAGMGPFTYSRKNEQQKIERWYELPEDVLLDPADLRDWVHEALAASRRSAKARPAKKKPVAKKRVKTPAAKKTTKRAAKKPVTKHEKPGRRDDTAPGRVPKTAQPAARRRRAGRPSR